MSQGPRRKFSAEDKAAILRHHLVDKKLVSDVCAEIRDPAERNLSTHSFCRLARRRDLLKIFRYQSSVRLTYARHGLAGLDVRNLSRIQAAIRLAISENRDVHRIHTNGVGNSVTDTEDTKERM